MELAHFEHTADLSILGCIQIDVVQRYFSASQPRGVTGFVTQAVLRKAQVQSGNAKSLHSIALGARRGVWKPSLGQGPFVRG